MNHKNNYVYFSMKKVRKYIIYTLYEKNLEKYRWIYGEKNLINGFSEMERLEEDIKCGTKKLLGVHYLDYVDGLMGVYICKN